MRFRKKRIRNKPFPGSSVSRGTLPQATSTLIRFQTKTELFCSGYGYRPTLQRQKRSPKTEPFENALQSGAIWKRCFLKTLFSSVDGENDAIWRRWCHQNHSTVRIQNGGQALPCSFNFAPITQADILKMRMLRVHLTMRTEGITAFSNRYGVVVWTGENDTKTTSVDANLFENEAKQLRFRLKTD